MSGETKINHQNYDLAFKEAITVFKNKSLDFLEVDLPRIVDIVNTEMFKIETKENFIDMNFILEDGSLLHLEEEIHVSEEDLLRFAQTDLVLYGSKRSVIHTVVVVLGNNKMNKGSIDAGSLKYDVKIVYMRGKDGDSKLSELKQKLESGEAINELELIFLPLMGSRIRERIEMLDEALDLTRQMQVDPARKMKIMSMQLVLMDKYITEEKILSVWEEMKMLNIIRIAEKKGIEQGIERGIEQGIERGIEQGMEKGKVDLFWRLLLKKFPRIEASYHDKIKDLDEAKIDMLSVELFDMKDLSELDRYL